MEAELEKLEANLGGVADMKKQPDAVFIIDLRKEQLAVREARRLGLPVVALVDTNCDPDDADFPIPGNDDAIRSCELITRAIVDAIEEGHEQACRRPTSSLRRPKRRPRTPPAARRRSRPRGGRAEETARPRRARARREAPGEQGGGPWGARAETRSDRRAPASIGSSSRSCATRRARG